MAPNERGSCFVCLTLNWECVCEENQTEEQHAKKRRVEADSDSEVCYDDIVEEAQKMDAQYGVIWRFLGDKSAAVSQAILIVTRAVAQSFYVGVCKWPADRYYEHSSAHCKTYQKMFVLCVGKDMGKLERKVLAACKDCRGSSACDNKSKGGERVHEDSIKFLYVCVRTASNVS